MNARVHCWLIVVTWAVHSAAAHGAAIKSRKVAVGGTHACALLDDGDVKCWGENAFGQLGQGDNTDRGGTLDQMGNNLPVIDLGAPGDVTHIAAGTDHQCALIGKGVVKCWGRNDSGQLGLGTIDSRGDGPGEMGASLPPVDVDPGHMVKQLAAGGAHTCALLDDQSVKCWGANFAGQLGEGTVFNRGNVPLEMGNFLTRVDLGTGRSAVQITAGFNHSCALLDDATVKCWGGNDYGQLGQGDTSNRGDSPGEMGNTLPAIDLGTGRTATHVVAGHYHTCALLDDGTSKCWGANESGQLGQGDRDSRGDDPNEMGDNLPHIALGWTTSAVTRIAAGSYHTCALLGTYLRCWGENASGALGEGTTHDRGDDLNEMGFALPDVDLGTGRHAVQIEAGWQFTCARLDNRRIKCWGSGMSGELGLEDMLPRGVNPGEMGDALRAVDVGTR
jgi:E3 ubiquitin-protein ligase HERC3